jgi:uncharacterized protein YjbJ (UPF0337 family)
MDSNVVKGQFKQLKGKIKQQGHAEILAGKLQERYGLNQEEAERQAKEFRSKNDWQ